MSFDEVIEARVSVDPDIAGVTSSGESESAEQSTQIEPPKRAPIVKPKPTKAGDPRAEREEQQKAAAKEAARQKEQAAEESKYRREYDQKQIEIQDKIARFTGNLVAIGYLQVLVAGIGLLAIGVAYRAAKAAEGSNQQARVWLKKS